MLESNHLSDEIRCYYSLASKNEDILGIGIEYTINPKTNELDYVTSEFDIISYNSFRNGGIRTTQWGEKFSSFLPIYIDEIHFNKTIDLLLNVAVRLVGGSRNIPFRARGLLKADRIDISSSSYNKGKKVIDNDNNIWIPCSQPEMLVTLLVKMMNTIVVLLCDNGMSVSEKSLSGYCQLHRLLIATVKRFPDLKVMIETRLNSFYLNPHKRVKSCTPSIGDLFCILSVSENLSWNKISFHALLETIDRSVLWACSKDNSLINVIPGDITRIKKFFDAQKIAFKLTAFHSVFLNLLIKGGGNKKLLEDCSDRYDLFSGRPPLYIQKEFRNNVQKILEMNSFNVFFNVAHITVPTSKQLLNTLEQAVSNSYKKGYHNDKTKFEKIHNSGVSKILLKGDSYTADPNIKTIQLLERWKFDGGTIFLDASCLVYNFNDENIGTVDYSNTHWGGNCINHSGDIIDNGTGEHSITINVKRIPSNVKALYFTVSAWTTNLTTIRQPSCHLHDSINDVELCHYKFEGKDTGSNTSVIMCKFHRLNVGDKWKMTSIGHVGMGRAGNYYPIYQSIKGL
jgi:stress response protein SCP2